tara:strand:+ start:4279 stop:6870 length:2592 start_codon:yes stop_codon:yes gene_type:complete
MTSSFQPQARPVDTFVRPSTVAPTDGFDQLVRALQTVNPGINKFIDFKLDEAIDEEKAKGKKIAIDEVLNEGDVAKLTNKIRKTDGDEAARQLIGGSIFAQRAYERTKTKLAGTKLQNTLDSDYLNAQIDIGRIDENGQPILYSLNQLSPDSEPVQTWKNNRLNSALNELNDISPDIINDYFMPVLEKEVFNITAHHIKEHKKYQFNLLQGQIPDTVTKAAQLFAKGKDDEAKNILVEITNDIYNAGVTGEDANKTHKLLIKTAFAKARLLAIDVDKPLSMEIAEDLPEKILQAISYGKGDLTDHKDYLSEAASFHEQYDQRVYNKLHNKPKIDREIKKRKIATEWKNLNDMTISEGETLEAFDERKKETFASLLNNPEYADKDLQDYVQSLGKSDNYELLTTIIPDIKNKIIKGMYDGYDDVLEQEIAVAENKHATMDDEATQAFKELKIFGKEAKGIGVAVDKSLNNIMKQVDKNLGTGGGIGFLQSTTTKDFQTSTRIRKRVQTEITKWYKKFVEDNKRLPSPLQIQQIETQYLWQVLGDEKVGGWNQDEVNTEYPPAVVDAEGNITSGYENPFYEPPTQLDQTGEEGERDTNKDSKFITPGMNFNQSSNQTQNQSEDLLTQLTNLIGQFTPGGSSPVAAGELEGDPTIHRVQSGDYLEKIANRYGLSSTDLIDANDLENPDVLQIGQELLIPKISKKEVQETKPKNLLSTPELTKLKKAIAPNIKDNSPIPRNYLIDLYRNAGFEGEDLKIMVAISLAESRGRPNAINKGTKDEPEESYGISQINMYDYPDLPLGSDRRPKLEIDKNEALYDPVLNALAARLVFNEFKAMYGDGFLAWSVYSSDGETKDENPIYVNFLE